MAGGIGGRREQVDATDHALGSFPAAASLSEP
jgi:hypothetical protein